MLHCRAVPFLLIFVWGGLSAPAEPLHQAELIFPLEDWHNHSSSIVELEDGGLLAIWFHGSGERKADDVRILGARKPPGADHWTAPFTVADYPGFPDTNCVLWVDSRNRLWMFWMTFLANEVHTTLLSYRVSTNYLQSDGPPVWERQGNLLLRPDKAGFEAKVRRVVEPMLEQSSDHAEYFQHLLRQAGEKYSVRTGWMVRTHPLELPGGRILLPLYSDVFDFSILAVSDDAGETWRPSEPIVGWGAVQPSLVPRSDGSLAAFMRDNGPAPKRVMMSLSMDEGESWGPVVDIVLPNPGSSVEAVRLRSGSLLIVYNDAEKGRHRLAVSLSTDDGQTWPQTRYLDEAAYGEGSFHYPSVVEGAGGVLHATYTYGLPDSTDGRRRRSIRYARFNQEWIEAAGDLQKQQ